jgi:hypothetical protein
MNAISTTNSTALKSVDIAGGDDPTSILVMLTDMRSQGALQALRSSIKSITPRLTNLLDLAQLLKEREYQSVVVLGDMSPDQLLKSPSRIPGTTIPKDAAALGYSLPTTTNLLVEENHYSSSGQLLWNNVTFESPASVATTRANYKQTSTTPTADTYSYNTTENGSPTKVDVIIHKDQGELTATHADIMSLEGNVNKEIGTLSTRLQSNYSRINDILQAALRAGSTSAKDMRVARQVEKDVNNEKAATVQALGGNLD